MSTAFEIDHEVMIVALSHSMGTGVFEPMIWECPCGSCDAYVAFARNEKAVWLVASHTFEEGDVVRVQGVACADAITELPKVYSRTSEKDGMFIALWLSQGLGEALAEAFEIPIAPRELN